MSTELDRREFLAGTFASAVVVATGIPVDGVLEISGTGPADVECVRGEVIHAKLPDGGTYVYQCGCATGGEVFGIDDRMKTPHL